MTFDFGIIWKSTNVVYDNNKYVLVDNTTLFAAKLTNFLYDTDSWLNYTVYNTDIITLLLPWSW